MGVGCLFPGPGGLCPLLLGWVSEQIKKWNGDNGGHLLVENIISDLEESHMRVFFYPEVVKIWSDANVTFFSHPIFGAFDAREYST